MIRYFAPKDTAGFLRKVNVPVAFNVHLAVLVGEPVSGGELEGALEEGLLHSAVLECEIGAKRLGVHLALKVGVLKKALDLRTEKEARGLRMAAIIRTSPSKMYRTTKASHPFAK